MEKVILNNRNVLFSMYIFRHTLDVLCALKLQLDVSRHSRGEPLCITRV